MRDTGGPVTLRFLGSTAWILQTDYAPGTKDADVLRPRVVRNCHRVQRDELLVDESEIDRPAWVGDE